LAFLADFFGYGTGRDASTKEAQTLPLTSEVRLLEHDRDHIAVLCEGQAPFRAEADGAIWFCAEGFVQDDGREPRLWEIRGASPVLE